MDWEGESSVKSPGRWLVYGACNFTALFLLLTCTPLERWWINELESAWTDDIPAVLLVLSAEQQAPGMIGYSTYLRLNYAVRFWRRGGVRTLVVSGGPAGAQPGEEPSARAMRDFLMGHGIPAESIVLEEEAKSTRENILNSRRLMERFPGTKGFLTSDYHSGRAARVCARLGVSWRPVPIPDAHKRWNNWGERWRLALDLAVETGKWIWYAAHSWI
jgi:uncharacterized SAM-binding protein YcdF (DUF218 family)